MFATLSDRTFTRFRPPTSWDGDELFNPSTAYARVLLRCESASLRR